jgi:hypothetical protein
MRLCTLPGSSARPEPVENTTSTGTSSAACVVSVVPVVSVNLQGRSQTRIVATNKLPKSSQPPPWPAKNAEQAPPLRC